MIINILGIDIAKNTFQLHGADSTGKAVMKKRLPRQKLAAVWRQPIWYQMT